MTNTELRFDAAINPHGCAPSVVAALEDAVRARAYRHYGDPDAGRLREQLGAHFDLPPESFLVYNGCGEGLVWQCLTRLLLPRGVFICPTPSYERFVAVGARSARRIVEVPLERPGWRLPIETFIDEARRSAANVAMISTPNNPTGNRLLEEASLVALLEAVPGCTFIIDEAYAEYPGVTFAPLVRRFPNLVVLKTFSKAYGLAGLRVGYVVAHPRVAGEARRYQIPWAVDSLALLAAETALADQAYLREIVGRIQREVADFGQALTRFPFLRVFPTDANFHLVELTGIDYAQLQPALAARRLVVRRRDDMPAHVRVTCMTPEVNALLLEAFEAVRS
jgi:histidinol-phosphate/aromatic aminotransferase/cobyric acid decarboxylase-like protein